MSEDTKSKCEIVFYRGLGEERQCGKPAVLAVTSGVKHIPPYPVCQECAKHCHPTRLIQLSELSYWKKAA